MTEELKQVEGKQGKEDREEGSFVWRALELDLGEEEEEGCGCGFAPGWKKVDVRIRRSM